MDYEVNPYQKQKMAEMKEFFEISQRKFQHRVKINLQVRKVLSRFIIDFNVHS